MTPAERDARLVLQGVLLTLSAIFGVLLAGCMFMRAQGYVAVGPMAFASLSLCFLGAVSGAMRWVVPSQRNVLRWTLQSLFGLLLFGGAGSLLVWCCR